MALDLIFAALALYAVISGARRGVVVQLAQLLAALAGVYGAYKFSYLAAVLLQEWGLQSQYSGVTAFICTFVLAAAAAALLGRLVHKLVQAIMLGWLNRLMGAVFALLKVFFLCSVALMILETINCLPQEQVSESRCCKIVAAFAPSVFNYLDISKLKDAARSVDEEVDKQVDTII